MDDGIRRTRTNIRIRVEIFMRNSESIKLLWSRRVAKFPFHSNSKLVFPQSDSEYNIKKQQRMADRAIELAAKYKKTVESSFENDVMKKVTISVFGT